MKVLSLFSGVGGMDLGFEWAGFETVAFCEIEKYPQEVLKRHWPNVPIIEDVRDVTKESVPGRIDCIIGGFPCQDISYAGKGAGIDYDLSEQEGTRSGLWWEYWRTIRDLRPRYVVAENVSALTNRGLDTVLGSLAQIGYDAEWQIVSAAGVGAAHIRERIFIVAYPASQQDDGIGGDCKQGRKPLGRNIEAPQQDIGKSDYNSPFGQGEVLAYPQHGSVPIRRGVDGTCEYVRDEGGIRQDDFGEGEQEETGEALAHADGGRLKAVNRSESVDKERADGRDIAPDTGQPDWFGGLQSQPHPVSFKVSDTCGGALEGAEARGRDTRDNVGGCSDGDVEHAERIGELAGRGDEQQESVKGKGDSPRLLRWVEIERYVRRVVDGFSNRFHEEEAVVDVPDRTGRLKGLGNAVVPQVAYLVAMAVRQHAEENGWWNE